MKTTRSLGIGLIGVALLAGCAAFHPMGGGAAPTINRDVNVASDGHGGCVVASVPDVDVKQTAAILVFNLKPANEFEFDSANGIKFVTKPGMDDPTGQFYRVNSSGTTWTFRDHNTKRGKFGYEVHVKPKAAGGKACLLDPIILNDGSCSDSC